MHDWVAALEVLAGVDLPDAQISREGCPDRLPIDHGLGFVDVGLRRLELGPGLFPSVLRNDVFCPQITGTVKVQSG